MKSSAVFRSSTLLLALIIFTFAPVADVYSSECPSASFDAAITKQITSVTTPTTLTIEIATGDVPPYKHEVKQLLGIPAGFVLQSLKTTQCYELSMANLCFHQAVLKSVGACEGDGQYTMTVQYKCTSCGICGTLKSFNFSLDTEYFCTQQY